MSIEKRPKTLGQAARLIGVRAAWLQSEAEAGRLPGFKAGDRWLFDLELLSAAIQARVRQNDDAPSGVSSEN